MTDRPSADPPVADRARFARALARFDAANAQDPNGEPVDGRERPRALVYAERMSAMLARFAPDASEALRLAARCQHIERWKIPRSDYPMDRTGYLQWRRQANRFHAEVATDILREIGYGEATVTRVAGLLRKEALNSDPEAQVLEDVVDLVFLESYLTGFVAARAEYAADKWLDILRKTASKMSARGRAAAVGLISLPAALAPLVERAMNAITEEQSTSASTAHA